MRRLLLLGLLGSIVLGCGTAGVSPGSSAAVTDPAPSAAATVAPSPSTIGQSPSPSVGPSPATAGELALESVAEVVTDDLRVRTEPGTDDETTLLEPVLPRGTKLYVIDGPVGASGYRWYQVLTFDVDLSAPGDGVDEPTVEEGWVAVADTTGEPWVQAAAMDCPGTPSTVQELVALDGVTALACFGGTPLTLDARILDCQTSPELTNEDYCGLATGSAAFQPGWFDVSLAFLVPPDGAFNHDDSMLELHLDPLGTAPDPLPIGVPVRVTGQYNHPAASACTMDWYFVHDAPTVYCRTVFAVTSVVAD